MLCSQLAGTAYVLAVLAHLGRVLMQRNPAPMLPTVTISTTCNPAGV